jgi:hypothetical protein
MVVKKLYWVLIALLCSACASNSQSLWPSSNRFGVVVNSALMHDTTTKSGIEITSDSGRHLAGYAELSAGRASSTGGQTSGYGGIGLPKWVDVSWRTGSFIQRYDSVTKSVWTGGTIVGNYRVEVASRIPQEILQYASAEKGRAITLMFRLLDDDVLLGWYVRELGKFDDWFEPNYSGDFMPAKWDNGKLVSMGWYLDKKTRQRIETTTGR